MGQPNGYGMESRMLFYGALSALRQDSGVPTRRKVAAKSVYQGIVTRAARNAIVRLPALLRHSAGPSLRRAVTARKHELQAAASPVVIVSDHIRHV